MSVQTKWLWLSMVAITSISLGFSLTTYTLGSAILGDASFTFAFFNFVCWVVSILGLSNKMSETKN